jgi:N-acetylneuraminic acid mutarotase
MNAKKNLRTCLAIALVLAVTLGLPSLCPAEEDTWTRKANMPTARSGLRTSVVDGRIYAIGGRTSTSSNAISNVEEYDPTTDTWTKKADMPTSRMNFATCVVNGKIYAMGGRQRPTSDPLPTVEEYNPATDTWMRKTDMPTARMDLGASAVNEKIYTIGGRPNVIGGNEYYGDDLSVVEEYDTMTDTWTRKTDMPTVRSGPSTCVVNGKVYAIGGYTGIVEQGARIYSTVEVYDPETDSWTTKSPMLTPRAAFRTCVVGEKIYAISGTPFTTYYSTVEEYDVATDTWTYKANIPTARSNFGASAVGRKIYVIGGRTWGNTVISTVEEYDTGFDLRSLDFNGDGIIDCADMCMMIEQWHTDNPLYDIAPEPLGDGIVDVQDLITLSEHLYEEILPPGCIAYWKLDDVEGDIAHNSAGYNDGILYGEPIWQPTDGQVNGAFEFDGVDDFIETDFVLNPVDGAFSVFAWVKGGTPGQVIISQADGTGSGETWLGISALDGSLMTGLIPPPVGRFLPQPLESQSVIADGQWHHVGFVWDGAYRCLYVDSIEVARDAKALTAAPLKPCDGGLYIGTSKTLDVGTFFSGLIDDIRIYDVVLSADRIAALTQ